MWHNTRACAMHIYMHSYSYSNACGTIATQCARYSVYSLCSTQKSKRNDYVISNGTAIILCDETININLND